MSEEINTAEPETNNEELEQETSGLEGLDEKTVNEIKSLRREAMERRLKNKELSAEIEKIKSAQAKAEENKMIEDGKLKELLEQKEAELEALKPLRDKVESYESQLKSQLDTVKSKLGPELQELIDESQMELSKKLSWALKLAEKQKPANSPDALRPGGNTQTDNVDLSEFSGPSGRVKLAKLKLSDPKRWEKIMGLKSIK